MTKLLFCFVLLLFTQASVAAYITDKLLAGYYTSPDVTTHPVRALPNGTPMEVLEEKGKFSRVRLGDNSEGWVETRYITLEKPARMMLLDLQAKYATLKRQTKSNTEEQQSEAPASTPPAAETQPRNMPDQAEAQTAQPQENPSNQVDVAGPAEQQLRQENALLRDRLQRIRELTANESLAQAHPRPETFQPWILPLIMLGLLLSFIAGVAFKNYRIARRAGQSSHSG